MASFKWLNVKLNVSFLSCCVLNSHMNYSVSVFIRGIFKELHLTVCPSCQNIPWACSETEDCSQSETWGWWQLQRKHKPVDEEPVWLSSLPAVTVELGTQYMKPHWALLMPHSTPLSQFDAVWRQRGVGFAFVFFCCFTHEKDLFKASLTDRPFREHVRSVSVFIRGIFREPHLTVCLSCQNIPWARSETVASQKRHVGDSYKETTNQSTKNRCDSVLCLQLQLNWARSIWSRIGHFLCPIQLRCHSSMSCDISVAWDSRSFSFVVLRMRMICLRHRSLTDRSVSMWGKTYT